MMIIQTIVDRKWGNASCFEFGNLKMKREMHEWVENWEHS